MNIENAEVEHFEKMAPHWWDKEGQCKPLHDLNPIRVQFMTDHVFVQDKKILDIGTGGGILAESLSKRGAIVTGIDVCEPLIEVARLHALSSQLDIHYEIADSESYAKEHREQFDVITCMELLEHVPNPLSLIESCVKLVKPEGHVFFSTLNRTLKAYALAILGAEMVLNLLPKGTHHYENFIKPSELNKWLMKTGLQLQDLKGLYYNPLTSFVKLTQDVSVNYFVYATKVGK